MKELAEQINAKLAEMNTDGSLSKLIKESVERTVEQIMKSALGEYSSFGKTLAEAVKKSLSFDPEQLGLGGYNQAILQIIRQKLDANLQTKGTQRIAEDLEQLLSGGAKETIKLSELVEGLKQWAVGRDQDTRRVTVILDDSSYGSRWIYLDRHPDKPKYECAFRLLIGQDDGIASLWLEGEDPKTSLFIGTLFEFEKDLFAMYVNKTKVIIDTEFPETGIDQEDD